MVVLWVNWRLCTSMSNWKNFERRVASRVGGKRIPITGRKWLDIDHPTLDIECKYRKNLPVWLFKDAWSQANTGSCIPVIAVGEYNSSDIFTIISIDTLVKLLERSIIDVNDDSTPTP